jgi:transposase
MFYGIDLGKESFKAAVLGVETESVEYLSCSLFPEQLGRFFARLTREDYVAVEASTNTFWFVEQIKPFVHECFVIDPWKFSIITQSNKKTDRIDSLKLAKRLKYHILFDKSHDEFPTIYIPEKTVQDVRSLFSTYELVKKEKSMIKNRVRSLLGQNGIFGFKAKNISHKKIQNAVLSLEMSASLRFQIATLIDVLNSQENTLKLIKDEILIMGNVFHDDIRILTSIKGISPFIALAILSDVADIKRFKNAKHLCSYLRAAPSIHASGDSTKVGHINRHSRHLSMCMLAESINHFRASNNHLNDFYTRKCKGKSVGKVRVAIIRKIIVAMFNMLSKKELYHFTDEANHKKKMEEYESAIKKVA